MKPAARERKRKAGGDRKSKKAKEKSLSQNLGEAISNDDDSDRNINRAAEQAAAALNVISS